MSDGQLPSCLVITDGRAGNENQCLGLAEALAANSLITPPQVQRVTLRAPWRQLFPYLRIGMMAAFQDTAKPDISSLPDLLLTAGRVGAAASLFVRDAVARQRSAQPPLRVHIMHPRIAPNNFDLVAAPRHDNLSGDNVIVTHGSLHRLTQQKIAAAAAQFAPVVAGLPRPYLAVLIGGSTKRWQMTPKDTVGITMRLVQLARKTGGSLIVTPSRRTGTDNSSIIRAGLAGIPHFFWDGSGENPYFGMIGIADAFFVTADSVNMITEACSTEKPVYIIPVAGCTDKLRLLHQYLEDQGLARTFDGTFSPWHHPPLDDRQKAVLKVAEMLKKRPSYTAL